MRKTGGGLAFIIDNLVKYRTITLPVPQSNGTVNPIEQQAIAIKSGANEIILIMSTFYTNFKLSAGYAPNIEHLLTLDDSIFMCDINGHHSTWDQHIADDARGIKLADQIDSSDHGILNDGSPTRITPSCLSSPEITATSSPSLLTFSEWPTKTSLNSDYVLIVFTLKRTVHPTQMSQRPTGTASLSIHNKNLLVWVSQITFFMGPDYLTTLSKKQLECLSQPEIYQQKKEID